jgi:hypothetical protein
MSDRPGIGTYRCTVIDVDDLQEGYRFWSAVTGLDVIGTAPDGWHGRFGYLGRRDPWKHEFILQVRRTRKDMDANRMHIDLTPNEGTDRAIERILELGGRLKKAPSLYPRPGSHGDELPELDWAVLQDPFGNEFCLVTVLTESEATAAMEAHRRGAKTDHEFRLAAGVTTERR